MHLAGPCAREERERQPLEVAEDRGPQVVHDALSDLVREQRLPHAEDAVDDRDHDHPGGVQRERPRVLRLDRLEEVAQQERGHHSEGRRDEDQPEDHAEAAAVGVEQARDALQVRPAHGRVGRAIGHLLVPAVKPPNTRPTVENAATLAP